MAAGIPRHAIENPVSVISTAIRPPDQIIQPWQFGHGEVKTTCLWLKGLPPLVPTCIVDGRESRILAMSPGRERAKNRSKTLSWHRRRDGRAMGLTRWHTSAPGENCGS